MKGGYLERFLALQLESIQFDLKNLSQATLFVRLHGYGDHGFLWRAGPPTATATGVPVPSYWWGAGASLPVSEGWVSGVCDSCYCRDWPIQVRPLGPSWYVQRFHNFSTYHISLHEGISEFKMSLVWSFPAVCLHWSVLEISSKHLLHLLTRILMLTMAL